MRKILPFVLLIILCLCIFSCDSNVSDKNKISPISVVPAEVPVEGLSLDVTFQVYLPKNYDFNITATVYPLNATNQKVFWTSSNTDIVTVDNTGKVKGIGVGDTVIIATTEDGNFSDSCSVKVLEDYYIVTFDSNGGTPVSSQIVYDTVKVTTPTNNPRKQNYGFAGWTTDSNAFTTSADFIFNTVITTNTTIYAKWDSNVFNITYRDKGNANFTGNHDSNYPVKHYYGSPTSLDSPTKSGFEFGGWSTDKNCTTTITSLGANDFTADITLYALWIPNTFSVTYNANEGSWSGSDTTTTNVTYNSKYVLPATEPTKTGYTFKGWYTETSGGSQITADTVVTITTSQTLYAHWTAESYNIFYKDKGNVTFSGNHGLNYPTKHYYGTPTTLDNPTRTGYSFGGWSTQTDCATTITSLGANDYSSDITLYAKWTANNYTVTYSANGGSWSGNTTATQIVTYDSAYVLPQTNPTYEGNIFDGWYDQSDAGNKIESFTKVTTASDHTIYAQWIEGSKYAVEFFANNATSGTVPNSISNTSTGVSFTVPGNTGNLARTGYTFAGWNTKYDGSGADYEIGSTKTPTVGGTISLYAKWTVSTYNITYKDMNGLSFSGIHGNNCPTTYTYGSKIYLVSPSKAHYTFGGWYLNPDCTGICVTSLGPKDFSGDITLYAKWIGDTYQITYHLNTAGANLNPYSPTTHTYGSTTTLLKPLKYGYGFYNWYTTSDCAAGSDVTVLSATGYTDEIHLYGKWTSTPIKGTAPTYAEYRPCQYCSWVQLWEGGPKWATMNIGATDVDYIGATEYSTANVGGLYSWCGSNERREGPDKSNDRRKNDETDLTLYGFPDTASVKWGNNWKMPLKKNIEDLINTNLTNWTWCDGSSTQYTAGCTLAGYMVSGKGAYSENSIFLPAAGYCMFNEDVKEIQYYSVGSYGSYWSYSCEHIYLADCFELSTNIICVNLYAEREYGQSVRAILDE